MSGRDRVAFSGGAGIELVAEFFQMHGGGETGAPARDALARRISSTFDRAFYPSGASHRPWEPTSVLDHLSAGTLAVLVRPEAGGSDVAYALFSSAECAGHRVLFVDSMGVAGPQGHGLGRWLVKRALERRPGPVVAARTQNPAFIRLLEGLGARTVLPGVEGYAGDDRRLLQAIVGRFGPEWADRVEGTTGICRRIYGDGRLGEYSVDRSRPSVREIEARLERLAGAAGFRRERGDAVVVVAKGVPAPEASLPQGRAPPHRA